MHVIDPNDFFTRLWTEVRTTAWNSKQGGFHHHYQTIGVCVHGFAGGVQLLKLAGADNEPNIFRGWLSIDGTILEVKHLAYRFQPNSLKPANPESWTMWTKEDRVAATKLSLYW